MDGATSLYLAVSRAFGDLQLKQVSASSKTGDTVVSAVPEVKRFYRNEDSSTENEDSSMILQWKMKMFLLKNDDFIGEVLRGRG